MPAYIYVAYALRQRSTGELVHHGWKVIAESAGYLENLPFNTKNGRSVLYYALANLTIKAWEAREAALQQALPAPRYIAQLRQTLLNKTSQIATHAHPSQSMDGPMDELVGNHFAVQCDWQYRWLDTNYAAVGQSYAGVGQNYGQPIFPATSSFVPGWELWSRANDAELFE